ncbi:MAG: hypothetical protein FP820_09935 [Sulfurimonas sp.]|nr:hypothetical protein [Sulfurimonas sp.]MBU3939596.1 hypothetical protein [bacterium]MBU4003001.1 hypothetical protein [Pseudomonadota bacterium]
MVYSENDLVKIFKNLGFIINKVDKYTSIEMSAYEAFIFSAITGATYLLAETGITMKGRNEIFIHRSIFQNDKYIYSPGLFSRDINEGYLEENSADMLKRKYPSVFKGKKNIILKEISSGSSSSIEKNIFKSLYECGEDTNNIILYKHFQSGSSFEPFLEYLTTKHFLSKGYLIENQVPWFQQKFSYNGKILNGGIPDFSAFHSNISSDLYRYSILNENSGIILNMIPLLKNFDEFDFKDKKIQKTYSYELIIGEAKSDKNSLEQALIQLSKYQSVELATELFTIITDVNNNENDTFGEIFINDFALSVKKSANVACTNSTNQLKDTIWMDNYIKALLLGNLGKDKIDELINDYRLSNNLSILKIYKSFHLIDMIIHTSIDIIINQISKK